MTQLDELDREILRLLKEDARLTISEIAERLKRPESTVHFRIKKLLERGIIGRYTIVLGRELWPQKLALLVVEVRKPIIEDFLERQLNRVIGALNGPNVLALARSGERSVVALLGGTEEQLQELIGGLKGLPTERLELIPLDGFLKGEELVGFLVVI